MDYKKIRDSGSARLRELYNKHQWERGRVYGDLLPQIIDANVWRDHGDGFYTPLAWREIADAKRGAPDEFGWLFYGDQALSIESHFVALKSPTAPKNTVNISTRDLLARSRTAHNAHMKWGAVAPPYADLVKETANIGDYGRCSIKPFCRTPELAQDAIDAYLRLIEQFGWGYKFSAANTFPVLGNAESNLGKRYYPYFSVSACTAAAVRDVADRMTRAIALRHLAKNTHLFESGSRQTTRKSDFERLAAALDATSYWPLHNSDARAVDQKVEALNFSNELLALPNGIGACVARLSRWNSLAPAVFLTKASTESKRDALFARVGAALVAVLGEMLVRFSPEKGDVNGRA